MVRIRLRALAGRSRPRIYRARWTALVRATQPRQWQYWAGAQYLTPTTHTPPRFRGAGLSQWRRVRSQISPDQKRKQDDYANTAATLGRPPGGWRCGIDRIRHRVSHVGEQHPLVRASFASSHRRGGGHRRAESISALVGRRVVAVRSARRPSNRTPAPCATNDLVEIPVYLSGIGFPAKVP